MRVLSLELNDVRQFHHKRVDFSPGFNLLVGLNGSGKTTILRALISAVGHAANSRTDDRLDDEDIRYRASSLRVRLECEQSNQIRAVEFSREWAGKSQRTGSLEKASVIWFGSNESASQSLLGKKSRRYDHRRNEKSSIRDDFRFREEYLYREEYTEPPDDDREPEFGRSEIVRRFVGRILSTFSPKFTRFTWRFLPYDCIVHTPQFADSRAKRLGDFRRTVAAEIFRFIESDFPESRHRGWGKRRSIRYKSNGHPLVDSKRIRSMPEFGDIISDSLRRYELEISKDEIVIEVKLAPRIAILTPDGPLLLRQLSDGEKRLFSIIVDIARQLSLVSGGFEQIRAAQGLIIVDEIDCHLHPKWQRAIVPALEDLFGGCQIIATSHSPFVIQAVPRDRLVVLDDVGAHQIGDFANSIEDIVEEIQGVAMPQRSKRAEDLSRAAERYFRLIKRRPRASADEISAAERAYREASEPFTLEPGLNALLRIEMMESDSP